MAALLAIFKICADIVFTAKPVNINRKIGTYDQAGAVIFCHDGARDEDRTQ